MPRRHDQNKIMMANLIAYDPGHWRIRALTVKAAADLHWKTGRAPRRAPTTSSTTLHPDVSTTHGTHLRLLGYRWVPGENLTEAQEAKLDLVWPGRSG